MPAGTTCSAQGLPGTIRIYGTPAEEGGAGKVFMIRAGLFRDVDAVLTWHPGNANKADMAALSPLSAAGSDSEAVPHMPRWRQSAADPLLTV